MIAPRNVLWSVYFANAE